MRFFQSCLPISGFIFSCRNPCAITKWSIALAFSSLDAPVGISFNCTKSPWRTKSKKKIENGKKQKKRILSIPHEKCFNCFFFVTLHAKVNDYSLFCVFIMYTIHSLLFNNLLTTTLTKYKKKNKKSEEIFERITQTWMAFRTKKKYIKLERKINKMSQVII